MAALTDERPSSRLARARSQVRRAYHAWCRFWAIVDALSAIFLGAFVTLAGLCTAVVAAVVAVKSGQLHTASIAGIGAVFSGIGISLVTDGFRAARTWFSAA